MELQQKVDNVLWKKPTLYVLYYSYYLYKLFVIFSNVILNNINYLKTFCNFIFKL